MQRRLRVATVSALAVLCLVALTAVRCQGSPFSPQALPGGVSNMSALQLGVPTTQATGVPGLVIEMKGKGNAIEVRNVNGTPSFQMDRDGAIGLGGGATFPSSNLVQTGPTAATTATPVFYSNNAADANDAVVIAKDATPVVKVSNGGSLVLSKFLQHDCTYVEAAANANSNLTPASSCYIVAVATSINLDYKLQVTNIVTGTMLNIVQIGAGTLVISDTNLLSSDGNAISLGAHDAATFIFDGTAWQELLKLAGS